MIKSFSKNQGQSLIEVIIAMAIFSLIGATMASFVVGGYSALIQSGDQIEAEALAEEGVEALRAISEGSWNKLIFNQSGIATSSNEWFLKGEGTSDIINQFTRTITFENVCRDLTHSIVACPGDYTDVHSRKAIVAVSWESRPGVSNSVIRNTYFTNWDSKYWTQTSWSGGGGQSIWSDSSRYDADDTKVVTGNAGEVKLDQTFSANGSYSWPFDAPGDYTYDADKIEVTGSYAQFKSGGSLGSSGVLDTGFEFTTETFYDWDFATAADYNYDSQKIEVSGGLAQLKNQSNPAWWDGSYTYRQKITITNNSASSMAAGYSVSASLNHYALVQAVKSLVSGNDVRIVYWNGSSNVELDRFNESVWNTNGTNAQIWFKTQLAIAGSGTDGNYYIYYGNASAGAPPANRSNIYAFFDDFEANNLNNWTDQIKNWYYPALTGQYNTTNSTGVANDVFVVGNTAYMVTNSGTNNEFFIIDITNPASPALLGSLNLGANAYSVYVSGNFAYLATGSNTQEMMVINITNPASLAINGSYNSGGNTDAYKIFVQGNYAYLGSVGNTAENEFEVINITSPLLPTLAGSYAVPNNPTVNGIYVSGIYAYLATSDIEFRILNINSLASITSVGTYDAAGTADGTEVFLKGSYAYLTRNYSATASQYEFYAINVSIPATPTVVAGGYLDFTANALTVSAPAGSSYAYVGTAVASAELRVIDITNQATPVAYSTLTARGNLNGIFADSGTVYLATSEAANEFKIIKPGTVWTVATDQRYAGTYALKVLPISNTVQWLTANSLSETDMLVESYWRISANTPTIGQGLRAGSVAPINQYESTLEASAGWDISKNINGAWTEIAANAGTPVNTNTWDRITTIISGQNMKVLKNGTQIVPGSGWTNVGSELSSGTLGYRAYNIAGGSNWWVDNVKGRKYVDPEPTSAFGSEENQSSFPSDKPAINPANSYFAIGVASWASFTETAVKNGGEIYYQLSSDNGAIWQFWNGTGWAAVSGATDYNTASVVNTNIINFSTSTEQILFKAFLSGNGTQQVRLDNVRVGLNPSASPWNFYTWGVGGGEVTPVGSRQTSGGNPNKYVDITVPSASNDEVGGYWQQAFTTSTNNPTVDFSFDYKVVDYNLTPALVEVRFFVDTAVGDPVNQVGTSISLSGEGSWVSVPSLDVSSFVASAGTYYLKMAIWVETSGTDGPFTIGFDNVNLGWANSAYPVDKPQIRNSVSFEPALIGNWLSFTETANKNTGEIYYQLSDNDGTTWQYWNGNDWVLDPDGDEGATENDYNTALAVNDYITFFSATNKKLMFKSFLAGDGSAQVQLDDLSVSYSLGSVNYYGNRFSINSTLGESALDNSAYMDSYRFRAQNTKNANSVRVYLQQISGISPTYRVGLQGDSGGYPDGVWLGASNTAYGDFQPSASGWQTINLNQSASLTAGTTYHLVIGYQSGTIGAGNSMALRISDPDNFMHPYNNASIPNLNVMRGINSGSSWTALGYQPIYIVGFTDSTYEGNPYHAVSEQQIYGANFFGEEFTIGSASKNVSNIEFYISKNSSSPADDLYFTLFDVTDSNLIISDILSTSVGVGLAYDWEQFIFPDSVVLASGHTYRIFLSSPGSASDKYYKVRSINHDNSIVYAGANYDGINSFYVYSANSGTDWLSDINYDIGGFRFRSTVFEGTGYVISSAFNTGAISNFNALEWDQFKPSCSPACEVKVQVQTAPDNGGVPGVWSATWCGPNGEDGNETDYYTTSQGQLIHYSHNNDQWIRYKAILSGDGTNTPILNEVRVNYK